MGRSRNWSWWTEFVPPGPYGPIKEQPRSLGHGERQEQVGDRNHGFPRGSRPLRNRLIAVVLARKVVFSRLALGWHGDF